MSHESPFGRVLTQASTTKLLRLVFVSIALTSAIASILVCVCWIRSDPDSTASDELELVCYFGCAAHSTNGPNVRTKTGAYAVSALVHSRSCATQKSIVSNLWLSRDDSSVDAGP